MLADTLQRAPALPAEVFRLSGVDEQAETVRRGSLTRLEQAVRYEHRVELVAREDPEAAEAMRNSAAGRMQPITSSYAPGAALLPHAASRDTAGSRTGPRATGTDLGSGSQLD